MVVGARTHVPRPRPSASVSHAYVVSVKKAMSSQVLSVSDEAGEEGKGGGKDAKKTQENEEVREYTENGVIAAEEDGRGESEGELDGEEELLYDTSSHEQLESSSGSGGSEIPWEERFAYHHYSLLHTISCSSSDRYRYVREQLEQVKAERDVLKQQLSSNPNAQKVRSTDDLCVTNKWREIKPLKTNTVAN